MNRSLERIADIDVSSDNTQIAQVAISYLRALRWTGGSIEDQTCDTLVFDETGEARWIARGATLMQAPIAAILMPQMSHRTREQGEIRWGSFSEFVFTSATLRQPIY